MTFLKNKSTKNATLKLTDQCYSNFDRKTLLIYFISDFSKAFNTVNHRRFYKKLQCHGTRGKMLNWLRSYLIKGFQYVEMSGLKSRKSRVGTKVPR